MSKTISALRMFRTKRIRILTNNNLKVSEMRKIINKVGSTVQLQDNFTDAQLEMIKQNDLLAPSGFPVIYANEYQGKIYLTNLIDVVLQIIEPNIKYLIVSGADDTQYERNFFSDEDCRHWIINHLDLSNNWTFVTLESEVA